MVVGWFIVMNIVQPRVMASSVGIHPVVVLVSVLIGLRLYGVVGAIFAIPVAAVISAFFFHYLNRSAGEARDVTSRAARRLEEREGRPVRVPSPPIGLRRVAACRWRRPRVSRAVGTPIRWRRTSRGPTEADERPA